MCLNRLTTSICPDNSLMCGGVVSRGGGGYMS